MLVDTGATMKTGNLQYHMWIMSQCPEIVDDFFQCTNDTVYNVIHLLAAIDLNEAATDLNHGQMTVVVRYKTPYTLADKGTFSLYFTLGNDVSWCSVLGLLTLLAMGATIDLVHGYCHVLDIIVDFLLIYSH